VVRRPGTGSLWLGELAVNLRKGEGVYHAHAHGHPHAHARPHAHSQAHAHAHANAHANANVLAMPIHIRTPMYLHSSALDGQDTYALTVLHPGTHRHAQRITSRLCLQNTHPSARSWHASACCKSRQTNYSNGVCHKQHTHRVGKSSSLLMYSKKNLCIHYGPVCLR